MLAIGLGLDKMAIRKNMEGASFLPPTPGTDLSKVKIGDMLGSFHHDYGLFTIHRKNRFPGLYLWTTQTL